jgi:DNA-binding MarR family transcriptional regulator
MSSTSTRQQQLATLITALQRKTDDSVFFAQIVAEQVGIHPTDLKVLSLLSRQGALSAGRIAELTGLTTGAITFSIDRLEKAGYARRVRHPTDRRSVLVEANMEPVQRDMGKYFAQMAQAVEQVVAGYSDAELAIILDFIVRMNEAAGQVITHMREESHTRKDPEDS